MTFDSEVYPLNDRADPPPSPYARDSGEDCDRRWVENSCRHANAVALLVGSLAISPHASFGIDYTATECNIPDHQRDILFALLPNQPVKPT